MEPKPIPEPTLRRLPAYYSHLKVLSAKSTGHISCTTLARDLCLDPSQIRKDFESIGITGKPRIGHSIPELLQSLEVFLGFRRVKPALLAGSGALARALMTLEDSRLFGLRIAGIFDTDEHRIGTEAEGLEIMPLGFLPDMARMLKAEIGIVTMPARTAQHAADLMVKGGIRAVWNFSPTALHLPAEVIIENENLHHSLATLSAKLAMGPPGASRPEPRARAAVR